MPLAPLLLTLQLDDPKLVAMHPESRTAIEAGALRWLFPESRTLPTDIVGRGFMPNVEALLTLGPELVVQWGGRGDDLLDPLERAGLRTAAVLYRGREDDITGWLELLGTLTGSTTRAQELLELRQAVRHTVETAVASISAPPPRVLYLFRATGGLQAGGQDSYMHYAIELAGGINVAASMGSTRPVSVEQVLVWNPDIILLNSFEAGLTPARIYQDPLLSLTPAARLRAVHTMPIGGYRWDPPSHESPLAWLWLTQRFWNKQVPIDYRNEARAAAEVIYGDRLSEKALRILMGPFGGREAPR